MVNSNNINVRHLQGQGLQLNQSDSKLLSKTFSNRTERFWKTKVCSDISNNGLVESEHFYLLECASSSMRSNTSPATGLLENLRGRNKKRPIIPQGIGLLFFTD